MTRLALALVVALAGCSSFIDDKAASSTLRILEKSQQAARRQPDLQLAREALPGGILQLEAFALAYPDNRGFRVMHADSLCQYAVAFVFDDWEDASFAGRTDEADRLAKRLSGLLASCTDAQLALLPPAWRDAFGRGRDAVTALLPKVTRAEIPHVLWLATAGAVQIATNPIRNLARLPIVKAMLARSAELAPGFRDADAEVLLGVLAAGQAALMGGDDGSASFARARELAGEGTLNVQVMFARAVAVARKDRTLFTQTLERVLAADLERWPERRLANELARKKAARYLAAAGTLFPK